MSVNHASMTTHAPHSLPSFAQAFSNQSLSNINSPLPPISNMDRDKPRLRQRSPPTRELSRPASEEDVARTAGRKRPHNDIGSSSRDEEQSDSDRASPAAVRVKEEGDQDMLNPSPSPPERMPEQRPPPQDSLGAPPPSSTMPSPVKKRRMTITGAPHALNTDVRVVPEQANSTPISPVVMGFTIPRDNPKELEQLKSMMSVKQKQKALIEQRRGSLANPAGATSTPPSSEERAAGTSKVSAPSLSVRNARRSPNGGAGTRRTAVSHQSTSAQRPASPNASVFQTQQAQTLPHQSAHTLPPPPISFARHRAAQLGAKRKPADIVISPREQQSNEQFMPSIHSAPPTQGAFYSGKHTMALPRLPNVMSLGESSVRRPAGNVPPTPTRFSQRMTVIPPSITISESTPRSPMASVPIASSLVPPTPAFRQKEFNSDKTAFLAPFSYFYDALNDASELKKYLADQLRRSDTLYQSLLQQQEKLNETVGAIVEKKMAGVSNELVGLRRRVSELEDALQESRSGRHPSNDGPSVYHSKGLQNGYGSSSGLLGPDSYTFPSSDHSRLRSDLSSGRVSSPRGYDSRGGSQQQSELDYENSSAAYDARRPSLSASRLDPPPRSHESSTLPPLAPPSRISLIMQSPPPVYHDSTHGKVSRPDLQRPVPSRQPSYNGSQERERERDRERDREWERERERRGESPQPSRSLDSRRDSVIMSPPDHRMDDA